ncbi:MAG: hypothetical protein VKP57_09055 [Candidatus Sericytochromatia bacterium]|nr:hypothetical protein [Candidatus Sericytochromatia bacterium]
MDPNQDRAMEQLVLHVMRTGSRTCPKCSKETLVSDFDEHYWKLHCTTCGFRHEDYMSGA